jgi:hypothetical protein
MALTTAIAKFFPLSALLANQRTAPTFRAGRERAEGVGAV